MGSYSVVLSSNPSKTKYLQVAYLSVVVENEHAKYLLTAEKPVPEYPGKIADIHHRSK